MGAQPWWDSYPPGVPRTVNVPDLLVPGLLSRAHQRHPDRTALWFMGRRIRYRTLRRDVRRFAAGLAAQGVGAGDRVSLVLPPSPQQVIALLGVQRLGAVAVLHNHVAPAARLRVQMRQCRSVGAVVVDHVYPRVKTVREDTGLRFVVVTALADYQQPGLKAASRVLGLVQSDVTEEWMSASLPPDPQSLGFMDLVRTPRGTVRRARIPSSAPAAVVFSADNQTGETATVTLSHRNLVAAATSAGAWLRLDGAGERVLTATPPFTAFGLLMTVLCLHLSATQVLTPRFEPVGVRAAAQESEASVLAAVPAAAQTLADIPYPEAPLGPVDLVVTGPEHWDGAEQTRVRARLAVPLVRLWGPAECCGVAIGTPRSTGTGAADVAVEPGSLGLPLPGVQARVVDAQRRPLPPGQPGELEVTGAMTAREAEPLSGRGQRVGQDHQGPPVRRWLATGRTVRMTSSGWFTEAADHGEGFASGGRVVSGGLELALAEVERSVRGCPGVRHASVVAVEHPYRGRALRAYVVPEEQKSFQASAMYAQLRLTLEPHMMPREVVLVDRVPGRPVARRTLEP